MGGGFTGIRVTGAKARFHRTLLRGAEAPLFHVPVCVHAFSINDRRTE